MVECLVVTLKVVSSNLDKGKSFFYIIENKVTESMTMVAPSGEQIKSLKSYKEWKMEIGTNIVKLFLKCKYRRCIIQKLSELLTTIIQKYIDENLHCLWIWALFSL